jgi:uncharacterized protein
MGQLLRIIIILLGLWLVLQIIKRALASRENNVSRQPSIASMVACVHCGLHLPESEAIQKDGKHFCCEEHLKATKNN